jgi:hypothetical protein
LTATKPTPPASLSDLAKRLKADADRIMDSFNLQKAAVPIVAIADIDEIVAALESQKDIRPDAREIVKILDNIERNGLLNSLDREQLRRCIAVIQAHWEDNIKGQVEALPFRTIQVSWKPKGLESRKEQWIRRDAVLKILADSHQGTQK